MRHVGPAWQRPTADDPDRLIVTFRAGTTPAARGAAVRASGARQSTKLPNSRSVALKAPTGHAQDVLAKLRADPDVLSASVDHRRFLDADPTGEPLWNELWGLENLGQDLFGGHPDTGGSVDADIDARQALGIATGDPATVVAVIDDGVDFTHPDLADRAWTNPGESGGGRETNGIDDDNNGYIDDVHGWDFCHNDNTVHDFGDDSHGTHVAGTIAASLERRRRRRRRAECLDHGAQVHQRRHASDCGLDSQAIAAIAYAKSFGVHIVNASWGARGRPQGAPDLYDAIKNSGMLFVAAAGNDSDDSDDRRTRFRTCRRPSTCRTSCRSRRSTTPAGSPRSRTTARRPSTSRRPEKRS